MANEEHLQILKQGVETWNKWREENPEIQPDLYKANLRGADLDEANLRRADLSGANLSKAKLIETILSRASLIGANLSGASLIGADLEQVILVETNLDGVNLTNCRVYGISAWNIQGTPKDQSSLIITRDNEPDIKVDDLEVAQFIYLLLNHQKLRNTINAVTERGVLILGRFRNGGLEVLQLIAAKLRDMKYLPIIFDFDRPDGRNYTETLKTLVGLSRFVVVDLSGPSVPHELYATVPHFKIPFVPIMEKGKRPYSMFVELLENDHVLKPIIEFASKEQLIKWIPSKIVAPAEKKHKKRQKQLEKIFKR